VSELLTGLDRGWSLGDVALAGEAAAAFVTWGAFPPFGWKPEKPEKPEEPTAFFLVAADIPVDRFVADAESRLETETAADLIGTQALPEECDHDGPVGRPESSVPPRS
jgi:hypothetical protein